MSDTSLKYEYEYCLHFNINSLNVTGAKDYVVFVGLCHGLVKRKDYQLVGN